MLSFHRHQIEVIMAECDENADLPLQQWALSNHQLPCLQVEDTALENLCTLKCLKSLGLVGCRLLKFSYALAEALEQLVELDISYNMLARIPPAVAHITTLQTLCLQGNLGLAFSWRMCAH